MRPSVPHADPERRVASAEQARLDSRREDMAVKQAPEMASMAEIFWPARVEAAPARLFVLIEMSAPGATLLFDEPVEVVTAHQKDEVAPALARLEAARCDGYHLAGYAGYELGYALEPRLARSGIPGATTPLIRFGVFGPPARLGGTQDRTAPIDIPTTPAWSLADYAQRFAACKGVHLRGRRLSDQPDVPASRPL